MSLKEMVEKHLAEVFDAHGLRFVRTELGGLDGKTGQVYESIEFSSALMRLRIERSDGEINAQIRHATWECWRYVREFSAVGLRDAPLEQLLARVPDRRRTDDEMLADLAHHVTVALQGVEKLKT